MSIFILGTVFMFTWFCDLFACFILSCMYQ